MSAITVLAFWAAKQVVCAAAPAVAKAVCLFAAKATASVCALRAAYRRLVGPSKPATPVAPAASRASGSPALALVT